MSLGDDPMLCGDDDDENRIGWGKKAGNARSLQSRGSRWWVCYNRDRVRQKGGLMHEHGCG